MEGMEEEGSGGTLLKSLWLSTQQSFGELLRKEDVVPGILSSFGMVQVC